MLPGRAGVVANEPAQWHWNVPGLVAIAYLALFGSALAYTSYTWLLKHAPADRVATFAYVNPAIATVLGWAAARRTLSRTADRGMLVVLLAVALVTLPAHKIAATPRLSIAGLERLEPALAANQAFASPRHDARR